VLSRETMRENVGKVNGIIPKGMKNVEFVGDRGLMNCADFHRIWDVRLKIDDFIDIAEMTGAN
jgi:hypothetical protein